MKTEAELNPQDQSGVSFGAGNLVAAVGTLSGMAIALGVPWVLLANGQSLGSPVLTTLIIVALCVGGLVSLTSAFFGLVIPRHVRGRFMDPEHWRKFAMERERWHMARKHWRSKDWMEDQEEEPSPRRRKS